MAEMVLIAIWLAMWTAAIYLAVRIAFWMWRTLVSGTGKAWRGK